MVKVKYLFASGRDSYLGDVTTDGIYETTEEIANKLVRSKRYELVDKEEIKEEVKEEIIVDKKVKKNKGDN